MSGTSRRKGNTAEVAVARWFRAHGFPEARTTRDARGGAQGGADITGVPGWAIEVKNATKLRLSEWWQQATVQAGQTSRPALIVKPAGVANVGGWVVFTDLPTVGLVAIRSDAPAADVLTTARCLNEPAAVFIAGEWLTATRVADIDWGLP